MAKTRTYRVENGRVLFKCPSCSGKRMLAVGPGVRLRRIRCNKCGEPTRCTFNRRHEQREMQSGSILVETGEGLEVTVDLFDLSQNGVGFDVSVRDTGRFAVGRYVQFKCKWNPELIGNGQYVVRSIKNQRIGVEKRT